MASRSFEREGGDHSRWVGCGRRDLEVVSDRDQRAFDKVMMDNQQVLVGRQIWERLVSMHLVLLNVLFLLEFQACRAENEMTA